MAQLLLRLSQKTIEKIDRWVSEGRFQNRSDAIRSIINFCQEREKTCNFFNTLMKRGEEAKQQPESLIHVEEF